MKEKKIKSKHLFDPSVRFMPYEGLDDGTHKALFPLMAMPDSSLYEMDLNDFIDCELVNAVNQYPLVDVYLELGRRKNGKNYVLKDSVIVSAVSSALEDAINYMDKQCKFYQEIYIIEVCVRNGYIPSFEVRKFMDFQSLNEWYTRFYPGHDYKVYKMVGKSVNQIGWVVAPKEVIRNQESKRNEI